MPLVEQWGWSGNGIWPAQCPAPITTTFWAPDLTWSDAGKTGREAKLEGKNRPLS